MLGVFWSGCWNGLDRLEKKGKDKKRKIWIQWNRIQWNDGSKIEFEKIYTKVKNIVEKNERKIFLIKIENKNDFFLFLYSRKRKEMKKRKKKKIIE